MSVNVLFLFGWALIFLKIRRSRVCVLDCLLTMEKARGYSATCVHHGNYTHTFTSLGNAKGRGMKSPVHCRFNGLVCTKTYSNRPSVSSHPVPFPPLCRCAPAGELEEFLEEIIKKVFNPALNLFKVRREEPPYTRRCI